jgi:hypothetical protein
VHVFTGYLILTHRLAVKYGFTPATNVTLGRSPVTDLSRDPDGDLYGRVVEGGNSDVADPDVNKAALVPLVLCESRACHPSSRQRDGCEECFRNHRLLLE